MSIFIVDCDSIVQKWSCQVASKPNWASTTAFSLERIAKLLPEIKHWQTQFSDYKNLPDIEATWFIDPPYQFGGEHYSVNGSNPCPFLLWIATHNKRYFITEAPIK